MQPNLTTGGKMETGSVDNRVVSQRQNYLWNVSPKVGVSLHTRMAVLLEGKLDTVVLKAALQQTLDHHEVLRTVLAQTASGLVQVPYDARLVFEIEDGEKGYGDGPQALVAQLFHEFSERAFPMDSPPVFHVSLVRLGVTRHLLLLATSAFAADLKSLHLFVQEVARRYAVAPGEPSPVEIIQYRDFAQWEQSRSSTTEWNRSRSWWRWAADGSWSKYRFPLLEPFSRRTIAVTGRTVVENVLEPARSLASAQGFSTDAVLMAAWMICLATTSRDTKVAVARRVDGRRPYAQLSGAFGPYARSVPISLMVRFGGSFEEVMERLKAGMQEAYDHEEAYVAEPGWGWRYHFNYEPTRKEIVASELTFRVELTAEESDPFEVRLRCVPEGSHLSAEIQFDAATISPEAAETLQRNYARTLPLLLRFPNIPFPELLDLG